MDGVKLYDVTSDSYITDRSQIVDRLVMAAANLMSWTERTDADRHLLLSGAGRRVLRDALKDRGHQRPLSIVVGGLWRSWVTPDLAT